MFCALPSSCFSLREISALRRAGFYNYSHQGGWIRGGAGHVRALAGLPLGRLADFSNVKEFEPCFHLIIFTVAGECIKRRRGWLNWS